MSTYILKSDALDFAYFYHNGLLNSERRDVEEEFEKINISSINFKEMIEKEIEELENEDIDIKVMARAGLKKLLNKLP